MASLLPSDMIHRPSPLLIPTTFAWLRNRNRSIFNIVIIVFQFCLLSLWAASSPPIFICAGCKMQFSQMTLKYCIVISEICFCSVALQSSTALRIELVERCFRQQKRSWKNSFNAFNLDSFSFTFHLYYFPSPSILIFNINIEFTSWLCSRNALDS